MPVRPERGQGRCNKKRAPRKAATTTTNHRSSHPFRLRLPRAPSGTARTSGGRAGRRPERPGAATRPGRSRESGKQAGLSPDAAAESGVAAPAPHFTSWRTREPWAATERLVLARERSCSFTRSIPTWTATTSASARTECVSTRSLLQCRRSSGRHSRFRE